MGSPLPHSPLSRSALAPISQFLRLWTQYSCARCPFLRRIGFVTVFNGYPGAGLERVGASIPNYFDRRSAIRALASVSIYKDSSAIVGDVGSPKRVSAARISPDFFATLGVALAMGHAFTDEQLAYGADQVAVLTDAFWRSHFNADPNVLGRTFLNDGLAITVVGVLPRNFHFLSSHAKFYRPASYAPEERQPNRRHSEGWEMVARLSPGSTLAEAQAQVNAFNAQQMAEDPMAQVVTRMGYLTKVVPLHADYVRSVRPMLVLLQCGALSLLAIGGVQPRQSNVGSERAAARKTSSLSAKLSEPASIICFWMRFPKQPCLRLQAPVAGC